MEKAIDIIMTVDLLHDPEVFSGLAIKHPESAGDVFFTDDLEIIEDDDEIPD